MIANDEQSHVALQETRLQLASRHVEGAAH